MLSAIPVTSNRPILPREFKCTYSGIQTAMRESWRLIREDCFPVPAAGSGYWFICPDTVQSRSAASGSSA
jgi:hypothetical protein